MHLRLWLLAAVFPALLAAQKVTVEFDPTFEFSSLKTFKLVNAKAEANADVNVRFTLGAANRREVERYPAGWRGWGMRRVAVRYTEGTLIIDLRDPRRQELVWRAIAVEDNRDPSKLQSTRGELIYFAAIAACS